MEKSCIIIIIIIIIIIDVILGVPCIPLIVKLSCY